MTDRWNEIRSARDYRSFLKAYVKTREINLSDLARAAGFGRGFPGDVISGKRRLTQKSSYAFEKALKLPAPGKKLFRFLVASEEADLFPEIERDSIAPRIEILRAKPWETSRRNVRELESPSYAKLFEDPRVALIYAAAGEPGKGATYEEIRQRTRLTEEELRAFVEKLERAGLLEIKQDQYMPRDLHLFLESGAMSEILVSYFKRACRTAGERVAANVGSKQEFFFSSAFCVREERLPELKKALRETILKFVDDGIDPNGDRVIQLLASLHL